MENNHENVKLTAAEVSYLWNTYLGDSMSICVFKYFLENIDDDDIKTIAQQALDLSQQHVIEIKKVFKEEGIAIPQGFTENDVNLEAKRLFTDVFYLKYIKHMSRGGLVTYGRILQNIFRQDIRSFFSKCLTSTIELDTEATRQLLEKGIAMRSPSIPYPDNVEFVEKQSFLLEGLGRRGALTGSEVTNLHSNIQTNQLGTSIATAFCQVTQSEDVRKFILRGKDVAMKHIKVFSDYLEMNSLPVPMSFDQEVVDSTEAPFSDKLMLFHFGLMVYAGIGNYGVAISESRRSDLVVDYSRLTAEILKYSEDFANLMIANRWLEQPPLAADRKNLRNDEKK